MQALWVRLQAMDEAQRAPLLLEVALRLDEAGQLVASAAALGVGGGGVGVPGRTLARNLLRREGFLLAHCLSSDRPIGSALHEYSVDAPAILASFAASLGGMWPGGSCT